MVEIDLDSLRVTLHVLAVSVWVGGQIVMAGLIPLLRGLGGDAPKLAARRFALVAWPAFAVAVFTGIWNLFEVNLGDLDTSYHMTLGLKLVAVMVSGAAAAWHSLTSSAALRGITAGLALLSALFALFTGVLLA